MAGWIDAFTAASELASRNLCRPGWGELIVVLAIVWIGTGIGCCCGAGWGAVLGYGAGRTEIIGRATTVALRPGGPILSVGARRRLELYANARPADSRPSAPPRDYADARSHVLHGHHGHDE